MFLLQTCYDVSLLFANKGKFYFQVQRMYLMQFPTSESRAEGYTRRSACSFFFSHFLLISSQNLLFLCYEPCVTHHSYELYLFYHAYNCIYLVVSSVSVRQKAKKLIFVVISIDTKFSDLITRYIYW